MDELKDGVPCNHPGCLSHINHPCEKCKRIGGKFMDNVYKLLNKYGVKGTINGPEILKLLEIIRIQYEAIKTEIETGSILADTLEAYEEANRIAGEIVNENKN